MRISSAAIWLPQLVSRRPIIHIEAMTRATASSRDFKGEKYVSAGKSVDGVTILMPAVRPNNFTYEEIKKTVGLVKGRKLAGRNAAAGKLVAKPADDSSKRAKRK